MLCHLFCKWGEYGFDRCCVYKKCSIGISWNITKRCISYGRCFPIHLILIEHFTEISASNQISLYQAGIYWIILLHYIGCISIHLMKQLTGNIYNRQHSLVNNFDPYNDPSYWAMFKFKKHGYYLQC